MVVLGDCNMYEEAKKYFNYFIKNNFDLNNDKIIHKIEHTYHVVDNVKYICDDMHLNKEDKDIAMIIALLHDIGRFQQVCEINSFREDINDYDHATLGAKCLFDTNEIRNFIKTNKYDNIIKKAILHHSEYILDETGMTEKERLHAKIIRDADKIDSFRTKATEDIYIMANITEKDIEDSKISDKVYNDFMNEKTIFSKDRKTGVDIWISYIAFIFGLEFNSSLKLVKKNNYVNKLFDRYVYKNDFNKIKLLKQKANSYLESRVK